MILKGILFDMDGVLVDSELSEADWIAKDLSEVPNEAINW